MPRSIKDVGVEDGTYDAVIDERLWRTEKFKEYNNETPWEDSVDGRNGAGKVSTETNKQIEQKASRTRARAGATLSRG